MIRQQFINLSEDDQNLFLSKLLHALRNNDECFRYCNWVVEAAECTGLYKDVKFGDDVINELQFDEAIVHPTKGLLFFNHKNNNQMITDPKDQEEQLSGDEPAVANTDAGNEEAGNEEVGGEGGE